MTQATSTLEEWNSWLRAAGDEASFTQSSIWAAIHRAVNGVEPYYTEVVEDGRRVAGALLGLRRPKTEGAAATLAHALRGFDRGVLECAGGPTICSVNPAATLTTLLARVADLARAVRARGVIFSNPPSTASWPSLAAVDETFRAAGYVGTPWATDLVDIARQDDVLLASFRQAARKGIRKCQEAGVIVRECRDSADYIENFSRPLFATRRALGMASDSDDTERHWWDHDSGGYYRYFIAQASDGTVLGTLGTYRWNGVATEIMSERTMSARDNKLPVQDLLHWQAFITHRNIGDRMFDLAGYSPAPATEKEAGIRAFKQKWQGRTVSIPRYERFSDPLHIRIAKEAKRKLAQARMPAENGQ